MIQVADDECTAYIIFGMSCRVVTPFPESRSRFDILTPRGDNTLVSGKENIMSTILPSGGPAIGFIGLGVMGEPMCGHLARRSGIPVLAYDLRPEPLARLGDQAVTAASLQTIAETCDVILLSLPDGRAVAAVVAQLEPHLRAGQCVVDTSTSSVELTRQIGTRLTAKGIQYADAPVARTREAASRGELSIMVGATEATFVRISPILETM